MPAPGSDATGNVTPVAWMNDLAVDALSKLSTPITRIRDSAPCASSCLRTAAASGGSSWWQLAHQAPKNSRTAGVPFAPPSAGTDTCDEPVGPRLAPVKDGTGPPSRGALVVLEFVPMLVSSPMSRMIRRPMPSPMRMNRLRGLRTTGGAPALAAVSASGAGGAVGSGGGASVMPRGR